MEPLAPLRESPHFNDGVAHSYLEWPVILVDPVEGDSGISDIDDGPKAG